jgi:hypothetical protein
MKYFILKLFLTLFLFNFTINSSIRRYISLSHLSDNYKILLNQEFTDYLSFNCLYDSDSNILLNISIYITNIFFHPYITKFNYFQQTLTYENSMVEYYITINFTFNDNSEITQNFFSQFFFNELNFVKKVDNFITYTYDLKNFSIDYSNIRNYSIVNEIIKKCDMNIQSQIKNSFDLYLKQMISCYPKTDNEYIIEEMRTQFSAMTDYYYKEPDSEYGYLEKINKLEYEKYIRIEDNVGDFQNISIKYELENKSYLRRATYDVYIDKITMNLNSKEITLGNFMVKSMESLIHNLLPKFFEYVFNIVLSNYIY